MAKETRLNKFKVTADAAQVGSDQATVVLWFNLAHAPPGLWDVIQSDGADLLVYSQDEVTRFETFPVFVDKATRRGLLAAKGTGLSSSIDTVYTIFCNDSTATLPAVTDTYGRNAVFDWKFEAVLDLINNASTIADLTGNGYTGTGSGLSVVNRGWFGKSLFNPSSSNQEGVSVANSGSGSAFNGMAQAGFSWVEVKEGSAVQNESPWGYDANNQMKLSSHDYQFRVSGTNRANEDVIDGIFAHWGFNYHDANSESQLFRNGESGTLNSSTTEAWYTGVGLLNWMRARASGGNWESFLGTQSMALLATSERTDDEYAIEYAMMWDGGGQAGSGSGYVPGSGEIGGQFWTWSAMMDVGTEITNDYYGDADVRRWRVRAMPAALPGSGLKEAYYWVITHNQLPAELIDSNEASSEASGAPTLRLSFDQLGEDQGAMHVLDFSPAAGGVGGGATAEINIQGQDDADHTNGFYVWLWWGKSGKTQPAADEQYGSEQVYRPEQSANYSLDDFSDSTAFANDGSATGVGVSTDIPFGSVDSWDFGGGTDRVEVTDDDSLDMDEAVTVLGWFICDSDTGTFQGLIAKRSSFDSVNYSLAFDEDGTMDWNFWDGAGFEGVGSNFNTNFGLGDWHFIAGTMEEVGSDVEVKLYNDTGLIASGTVLSNSLPINSHVLQLGNLNQSSWGFPLDGRMKAWNVLSIALDADQIAAIYNNQSRLDPGSGDPIFWDISDEVEDGPFPISASGSGSGFVGSGSGSGFVGSGSGVVPGSGSGVVPGSGSGVVPGSGSGSGVVPGSGSGFIPDDECYPTIARDTAFNRLLLWQERSGAVVDIMGWEALANATPVDRSAYYKGSASTRLSGSNSMAMRVIKSELIRQLKKMEALGCDIRVAMFGFVRHDMWLVDSRLAMWDAWNPGGRIAGSQMIIHQARDSGAIMQLTNILEFAPWYNSVAIMDTPDALGSGSGSGFASGSSGTWHLLDRKNTSFNGPTWQVAEGDSVDSLGSFTGIEAVIEFVFPAGTMVLDLIGNWAGTLSEINWNGGTIEETTKVYDQDGQVQLDEQIWKIRISVTRADEMPRLTVNNAGQSQGVREGLCLDCSDPGAVASGVPPWVQKGGPIYFVNEDDDHFMIMSADFTVETDTGLDLTSLGIIDISRHQVNAYIYGLTTGGSVYRWRDDGTEDPELVFTTGFSDLDGIIVDTANDQIILGSHFINFANRRWYVYGIAGGLIHDYENRLGLGSIDGPSSYAGNITSGNYAYWYVTPGLIRYDITDGSVDDMQSASGLEFRAGAIDDITNQAFRVVGSAIYQYNPVTVNNPSNAFLVAGNAEVLNSDWMDFFQGDDGVNVYVMCGAGRISSWRVNAANVVRDRSVANARTLTCRRLFTP